MGLRRVSNNIERRLQRLQTELERIPDQAYQHFKSITPIDTGNAKRSTRQSGDGIVADYNYANRLNDGYSGQAPDGMTNPTVDYIRNQIRKI